jgi:hypothetical protein
MLRLQGTFSQLDKRQEFDELSFNSRGMIFVISDQGSWKGGILRDLNDCSYIINTMAA